MRVGSSDLCGSSLRSRRLKAFATNINQAELAAAKPVICSGFAYTRRTSIPRSRNGAMALSEARVSVTRT